MILAETYPHISVTPEGVPILSGTTIKVGEIEAAITARTRAIVPTHLYGQPCDMDPIVKIAREHNLAIIEDCAHALGASYKGRKVGTFVCHSDGSLPRR